MAATELEPRSAAPSDRPPVAAMFRDVFGSDRPAERWTWQYEGHPSGRGWNAVVDAAGSVAAHHGLMRQHLCHLGREVIAAQECDAMVSVDLRGRGVYTRLAEFNYGRAAAEGLRAVFAFPSRRSFPGSYAMLMRRLDYRRVGNLRHYWRRIGWGRVLGRAGDTVAKAAGAPVRDLGFRLARLARGAGVDFEVADRFPEDFAEGLGQIRDYEVVAIWKDLPYLRWRYELHPEHRYRFHVLRASGRPQAVVVARERHASIALCEVLHRRKDVAETALLLRHVVRHYASTSAQSVEFHGLDNGFFDAAFEEAGFRSHAFARTILGGRVFGSSRLAEEFPLAQNWSLAYGDLDMA